MATRDYTLGKGKVLFRKSGDAAYMDLGNAPAFTTTVTIDKIEHFGSRGGLSKKDLEVITKMGMGGSFTLDEPNGANLGMFVMSAAGAQAYAQGSISAAAAQIGTVVLDRWYPLTVATGAATFPANATPDGANVGSGTLAITGAANHVTANLAVRVLVIADGATGSIRISVNGADWTTAALTASAYTVLAADGQVEDLIFTFANHAIGDLYAFNVNYVSAGARISNITSATITGSVENTDFILDKAAGLVFFPEAGNIVAGSTVTFATTVAAANAGRTKTLGGTLTSLKGDIYFVGDPPQGRIVDIMGFCSLTPNGDLSVIGEDWMQVQFNIEFLEVAGVPELIQVIDRGKAGTL